MVLLIKSGGCRRVGLPAPECHQYAVGGTIVDFIRRHKQQFDHWSSILLSFGLGYIVLSLLRDLGPLVAMSMAFLAALFRAWLFAVTRRPAA